MPEPSLPLSSRGRATRRELLLAARAVFEERGFVDTRVSHIAKAAKVAYGSFYTHFPSKEAIFYEVATSLFEEMFAPDPDEEVAGTAPASARERLERANRTYWERYRRNARLMAIVEQVSTIDQGFRELRQQHRRDTTERTARSIGRWQEQGLVSPEIDPRVAAQALGAMLDRTLYLRCVLGETEDDDAAIETVNLLTVQALGLDRD